MYLILVLQMSILCFIEKEKLWCLGKWSRIIRTGFLRCIRLMMKKMHLAKMMQSLFLIPWITKLFAFHLIVKVCSCKRLFMPHNACFVNHFQIFTMNNHKFYFYICCKHFTISYMKVFPYFHLFSLYKMLMCNCNAFEL